MKNKLTESDIEAMLGKHLDVNMATDQQEIVRILESTNAKTIENFFRPDHEHWIRVGRWTLRQSVLLLHDLEPSRVDSFTAMAELLAETDEEEAKDTFAQSEAAQFMYDFERKIEKLSEYLCSNGPFSLLTTTPLTPVISSEQREKRDAAIQTYAVPWARVLNWAVENNFSVPTKLKLAAEASGKWKAKTTKKEPAAGNISTRNRIEILGAAVTVLTRFSDELPKSKQLVGAMIYDVMDEKGPLLWPNSETGKPPLSKDKASRIINSWINYEKHKEKQ